MILFDTVIDTSVSVKLKKQSNNCLLYSAINYI
jgi:hypothetical protein